MKLRAFQKWPQNSSIFRIFGDRALFIARKISNFAILKAPKKRPFFKGKL